MRNSHTKQRRAVMCPPQLGWRLFKITLFVRPFSCVERDRNDLYEEA
ncbi:MULTISPECIES: hypothetical protein [unclassified Methanosarcina]|nr:MULTISPECIES: hypothetical protein [unclassified Methanosarcina]